MIRPENRTAQIKKYNEASAGAGDRNPEEEGSDGGSLLRLMAKKNVCYVIWYLKSRRLKRRQIVSLDYKRGKRKC